MLHGTGESSLAFCDASVRYGFFAILIVTLSAVSSHAQESNATTMWGTGGASDASGSYLNSANFHVSAGVTAGQENAARKGLLFSGPSMTVVGSQTIVQVSGINNVVQDIDQSAVNSGSQHLNAEID